MRIRTAYGRFELDKNGVLVRMCSGSGVPGLDAVLVGSATSTTNCSCSTCAAAKQCMAKSCAATKGKTCGEGCCDTATCPDTEKPPALKVGDICPKCRKEFKERALFNSTFIGCMC